MDCSKAVILIDSLADGELIEKQMRDLLDHIAVCPECSAKYNEILKIKELVKDSPRIKAPADFINKLHLRMENEGLIEKRESAVNVFIHYINRPFILRPAAAVLIAGFIMFLYRPYEFLSRNFKAISPVQQEENLSEYSVKNKDVKTVKFPAAIKKQKAPSVSDDRFESSASDKTASEGKGYDEKYSPQKEDKKQMETEELSYDSRSDLMKNRQSRSESPSGVSSKRKASAGYNAPSEKSESDSSSMPGIESFIYKYKVKIIFRDDKMISVSVSNDKLKSFINSIESIDKKYLIKSSERGFTSVDLFLQE